MEMRKTTVILSGILGIVSIGGILMYANPDVQEGLTSNIVSPFRKVLRNTPATPTRPGLVISRETAIQPTRIPGGVLVAPTPSFSGEAIIRSVIPTNTGIIIPTGSLTMVSDYFGTQKRENISEAGAKDICMTEWEKYKTNQQYRILTCTWNGKIIYSIQKGYTPTMTGSSPSTNYYTGYTTTPTPSGWYATGTIIPKPTTITTTGSTSPISVNGSIVVTVDGKNQPDIYNTYKLSETEAMSYCANLASKVLTTSKFSCIWNGNKEMSKGYGTKVVTPTSTGSVMQVPATPILTGSTSSGAQIKNTMVITVDGKNQPDIYNNIDTNYGLSDMEAVGYCANLASKVATTSTFSCVWNGKELGKGFGTKVMTTASTGSTSSGSTSTGSIK